VQASKSSAEPTYKPKRNSKRKVIRQLLDEEDDEDNLLSLEEEKATMHELAMWRERMSKRTPDKWKHSSESQSFVTRARRYWLKGFEYSNPNSLPTPQALRRWFIPLITKSTFKKETSLALQAEFEQDLQSYVNELQEDFDG